MSHRESSLLAEKNRQQEHKAARIRERDKSLDELIERWCQRWSHNLDETPECPERDQFKIEKMPYGDGRGRHPTVSGWAFSIEDVEFIYDKQNGLCVVLTCPDCGERHADSWYGMDSLGKHLRTQRAMFHKCHAVAIRELAYAIRHAQDATKLPADTLFDEAVEVMSGWRSR